MPRSVRTQCRGELITFRLCEQCFERSEECKLVYTASLCSVSAGMSDVMAPGPALSPMPILKMEGGGVMPMTSSLAATSVIQQPVMGQVRAE